MLLELSIARRFAISLRKDAFSLFTTIATTASIALGYSAVCIALSILDGYQDKIIETATHFTSDVIVRSRLSVDLENANVVVRQLLELPDVTSANVIFEREALVKHRGQLDGVMLTGITSARYHQFSKLVTRRLPNRGLESGVILGAGICRKLGVQLGDSVRFIMQKHGSEVPSVYRMCVVGTFESGMGIQDDNVVMTNIDTLRSHASVMAGNGSAILVTTTSADRADKVAERINATYQYSLYADTYQAVFSGIWSWIELQRKPIPIVLGLLSLVAVVSIVSALFLTIVQKSASIAILSTIGMRSRRIGAVILLRATISAIVGVLCGASITYAFVRIQSTYQWIRLDSSLYYVSVLPVKQDNAQATLVALAIVLLTMIVSIVPLMAARKIRPSQALRFS